MICTDRLTRNSPRQKDRAVANQPETSKPTDPVMPDVRTLYRSVLSGPIIPEVHASKDGNSR
jgi:hypothetical protein